MLLVASFETLNLADDVEISRGCFVPDNKLLLLNYYDNKVYRCDHDGFNTKTINLDYKPYDVTLSDRNTALVSIEDKGIHIIDLKTLKPGKRIKAGSYCHAITSLNGNICMKSDNNFLTMIDIKGKVQKEVPTSFNPYHICLSKDGDIYCTDRDSDNVYVVTSGGEDRVAFSSPELTSPSGITVDDYGDVYIAGYWSNNRISSDGKQSNIILTEEDGIKSPFGLTYNHQTKELMVMNNLGTSINIYKVR